MTDDERDEAIDAECDLIRGALTRLALLRNPDYDDDPPYVIGWTATVEWTNTELERNGQGGVFTEAPRGQSLSASRGLGEFAVDAYRMPPEEAP